MICSKCGHSSCYGVMWDNGMNIYCALCGHTEVIPPKSKDRLWIKVDDFPKVDNIEVLLYVPIENVPDYAKDFHNKEIIMGSWDSHMQKYYRRWKSWGYEVKPTHCMRFPTPPSGNIGSIA